MIEVSEKLKIAIKLAPEPAYKIAQRANLNPSTLSKLICGITKIKSKDPRVIAVGKVLGVSEDECFSNNKGFGKVDYFSKQLKLFD